MSFYHFLFSRYLDLTERHFSSDNLVSFPDSSDLDSRDISGNTGTYQNCPCEETVFGSNKIKEQHETMKLQNEEVMLS